MTALKVTDLSKTFPVGGGLFREAGAVRAVRPMSFAVETGVDPRRLAEIAIAAQGFVDVRAGSTQARGHGRRSCGRRANAVGRVRPAGRASGGARPKALP